MENVIICARRLEKLQEMPANSGYEQLDDDFTEIQ